MGLTFQVVAYRKLYDHDHVEKKICKSFKLDKSNAVSMGTPAVKPYLSICPVGLVCLARYCENCTVAIFTLAAHSTHSWRGPVLFSRGFQIFVTSESQSRILNLMITELFYSRTVNSPVSDHPLCKTKWSLTWGVAYGNNRIYNKILDRDWFSACLFVT